MLAAAVYAFLQSARVNHQADILTKVLEPLTHEIDSIEQVDAAAVQRYAAAHLGAAGRRVVVAGVADRIVGALPTGARPVEVIPADELDLDRVGLKRTAPR